MSVASAINSLNYTTPPSSTSSTSSSSTNSSSSSSTSATDATTAYNTFLTLLTTQLQHQDPLNPTDSSQFTSQLIQLSSVEQQEKTNSQLASIASALSTVGLSSGVAYLDKSVVYNGSSAPIQNGSANWSYSLSAPANSVILSVKDASGQTVYSTQGDTASGGHNFSWDGTDTNGNQYSSGNYTLTVTALDSSGNAVSSSVYGTGKVTGIDSSSGSPVLLVGDASVQLSDVIGVKS